MEDIDRRLQFLVQSTESLHASVQELHATVQQQAEIQAKHEQRWERMRRVMAAGLQAALGDEEEGGNATN